MLYVFSKVLHFDIEGLNKILLIFSLSFMLFVQVMKFVEYRFSHHDTKLLDSKLEKMVVRNDLFREKRKVICKSQITLRTWNFDKDHLVIQTSKVKLESSILFVA